jgi:PST family polysaccharide transporter
MMQDAWPLIFAGLSSSVYMKVDQVMLGEMVGESSVGIYATAVKISELWYFIPTAIASSVFPKIVSSKENASEKVYRERMQVFYDLISLLSYIVIIVVVFSADPLIDIIFGEEYKRSATILKVHIWAFLFASFGAVRGKWLVAENMTNLAMLTTFLGAALNVGVNIFLIPEFGGVGAAWATFLSQGMAVYISCLMIPPLRGVFIQMTKAIGFPFRVWEIKKVLLDSSK